MRQGSSIVCRCILYSKARHQARQSAADITCNSSLTEFAPTWALFNVACCRSIDNDTIQCYILSATPVIQQHCADILALVQVVVVWDLLTNQCTNCLLYPAAGDRRGCTNQWILSSLTLGIFESTLLQFYLTSESSGRTNKLWLDDSRVNCWACVFAIFFSTILISIKASSSLDFGVESTDSQRRHWESKFSSCHAGRPRVHPDYKAQKFPDRPK